MTDVLVERGDEGVTIVTLNRPERMNAWTREMAHRLSDIMSELEGDDATKAIVVTGAGRAFCAGLDMTTSGAVTGTAAPPRTPWSQRTVPSSISKPVAAAINGHAVGIGLAYALHCDVRFVAADAKLSLAFVRRGMVPEMAMDVVLARLAGHGVAADLLVSGRTISGQDAVAMGLASSAGPADEVLPAAMRWATDVAANSAGAAVGAVKQLLWGPLRAEIAAMMDTEDALAAHFVREPDAAEGMRAFLDKRTPVWTGSHRDGAARAAGFARRDTGPHG